jgi:hypothetical protein
MWLRRRAFRVPSELPKKCFVSHAYRDTDALRSLTNRLLESGREPYIFPPISVTPDQMVSAQLIREVLGHEGFIFLKEGNSAQSFWVAFERDIALRAGKKVYSFSYPSLELQPDHSKPRNLTICAHYASEDYEVLPKVKTTSACGSVKEALQLAIIERLTPVRRAAG